MPLTAIKGVIRRGSRGVLQKKPTRHVRCYSTTDKQTGTWSAWRAGVVVRGNSSKCGEEAVLGECADSVNREEINWTWVGNASLECQLLALYTAPHPLQLANDGMPLMPLNHRRRRFRFRTDRKIRCVEPSPGTFSALSRRELNPQTK